MTKPEAETGERWTSLLFDPPNPVAAIATALTLAHLVVVLAPHRVAARIWRLFDLAPSQVLRAASEGEYLNVARPFLGHMFFHVNLPHLLINLAAVLVFGGFLCREMETQASERKSDGPAAFIAFFVLCGLAGGLAYVMTAQAGSTPMIGASGAAAGLAGASLWVFVTRDSDGRPSGGVARNAAILALISVIVISLSFFLDTSKLSRFLFGSISAWQAHIGGYVFGLASYPLFERFAGRGR
ncbi:rhomboid family intramembrane serine protease [Hyphococcus sp.]|jgi:membrane associated rhomboid family serine protease|uniref:rhomboid family intramembrane serine protease n=1 Tax=Hyphococcus sp. TaxID=2038636 RepID=UPI003D144A37